MTKYQHMLTAFVEALNKLLPEQLFKVQHTQELINSEKVSSTGVKHLYKLEDQLNDTQTQMTGMKPKDTIGLKELPLVNQERTIPQKTHCLRMDCIINLAKNTTTIAREPLIGYGLRRLTD